MKKHKILVSAYGCEPFRGSEAGVGWNWVLEMAKENSLFVITRLNDKEKIEKNIPEEIADNVKFYYYDTCSLFKKVKNKDKGLYIYYFFWQIGIIKIIRSLIKENSFDYTMHLSFGSLWMPTFLPFFNVPFIWGPLGGGDSVPKEYIQSFPVKQRIVQGARYILKATSFMNPLVAVPSKKAVAILARTENTAEVIPKKYLCKVRIVLETAMGDDIFNYERKNKFKVGYSENKIIELIVTGRLVPFKNAIAAVEALCSIPENYNVRLTIVGNGTEKEKIINTIHKYHLENKVNLIPEIPREEVMKKLTDSDIYVFPSLREGGSWALMEGMAIGLPVICLNWTGMKIITNDESAIRIEPSNPIQTPKDIAKAICSLIDDDDLREKMGQAARDRIKEYYNWDIKGKFMRELMEYLDKTL